MAENKIISYDVELLSTNKRREFYIPEIYTNDLYSNEFQFNIIDMTASELSGATATVLLDMKDGSFFNNADVTRSGNTFKYVLKENEGNHFGVAEVQLVVKISGKDYATPLYKFAVMQGLDDRKANEVVINDLNSETRREIAKLKNETNTVITDLSTQFQQVIDETTGKDIVSAPEIIAARGTQPNLSQRLVETDKSIKQISPINVIDFGADNTGFLDSTDAFKAAIKKSIRESTTTNGYFMTLKILVPYGEYLIKNSIVDETILSSRIMFIFVGDGWQSTKIKFIPDSNIYLFKNADIFGGATFTGIDFISNNIGRFLLNASGKKNVPQSFVFNNCQFSRFNELLKSSGNTMASEVTFNDCKIRYFDSESVIFNLDNPQAVNWRFFGTDIEVFKGKLFQYRKGMSISFFQGSIIPEATGVVVHVPFDADPNQFGDGNAPHLQVDGCRLEMRENTKLLLVENKSVLFQMSFKNAGMGGKNIDKENPNFPIDIKGKGYFYFDNCVNWDNYKIKSVVDANSDYLSPAFFHFKNKSPNSDYLTKNSIVELSGANIGSSPVVVFENADINGTIRLKGYSNFIQNSDNSSKEHYFSFTPQGNEGFFGYGTGEGVITKRKVKLPMVRLRGIKYKVNNKPSYGNEIYRLSFYRESDMKLIYTKEHTTQKTEYVDLSNDIFPIFFNPGDYLIFQIEPITTRTDNLQFFIDGFLCLYY